MILSLPDSAAAKPIRLNLALQQWLLYCPWLPVVGSWDHSLGQSAAPPWPLPGMGGAACCSSAMAPGHLLWSQGPLGLLPGSMDSAHLLPRALGTVPVPPGGSDHLCALLGRHAVSLHGPHSPLVPCCGAHGVGCQVLHSASLQPGASWHFAAHHPVVRELSPRQLRNFVSRPPDLGGPPPRRAVLSMSGLSHGVIRVDAEEKLSVLTVQDVGQVMPGGEGTAGS